MAVRCSLVIVVVLLALPAVCTADTFTVPLDVNELYDAGQWTPFEFDLGVALCHVSEVRFICEGTVTGGLDYQTQPFSWCFNAYLNADIARMVARGPKVGAWTYPQCDSFSADSTFAPLREATWDFLLDGRAAGSVGMSEVCYRPDRAPRQMPSGCITSAYLVVEATVVHPMITYYVDADAPGDNDGSSWANAFNYLQDALAAASYGDRICVARGLYTPDLGAAAVPGDRNATFRLKNGVSILGGYAGFGEPDPNARDIREFQTVLSGDLAADDTTRMDSPTRMDNSYHVVTADNVDHTAVLDGFTITAGYANASANPNDRGGGMCNISASPTVLNCAFTANAALYGGAMANLDDSCPTLTNCAFTGNSVHIGGGAVYNYKGADPTLTNCAFAGNFARYGAAMMADQSSPVLRNCTFAGNFARENGGALYLQTSSVTLTNCTLACNSAGRYFGGGIYNHQATSKVTLANCILWNNTDNGGPDQSAQVHGGRPAVEYSCIRGWNGGWGGPGNTGQDPLFVCEPSDGADGWGVGSRSDFTRLLSLAENDDFGDLHLCSQAGRWNPHAEKWVGDDLTSPCIDAGCPTACRDNERWPHGKRLNIGAYGGTVEASMSLSDAGNVADLNGDDAVNFLDYNRLAARWAARGLHLPEDLDASTAVNAADLSLFSENWLAAP